MAGKEDRRPQKLEGGPKCDREEERVVGSYGAEILRKEAGCGCEFSSDVGSGEIYIGLNAGCVFERRSGLHWKER